MKKINKLFTDLNMSYKNVFIFAVVCGIYTGFIMLIPFLNHTSFQDIGISYEWWVVFAIIVCVNCKSSISSAIKCFLFFLISQPLIFIVEIIFGDLSVELAKIYYFKIWFKATLLTLPGGFICYYCKKQNLIGSIILGIGNFINLALGAYYVKEMIADFPHHLLTSIFCFASIIITTHYIQKEKKNKIITMLTSIILLICAIILARISGLEFI